MTALDRLREEQHARLRLGDTAGLSTLAQAASFVETVAIALRYGASDTLPIASMYQAVWRLAPDLKRRARSWDPEPEREAQRRATVLTNALIDAGTVIETTVIADRVAVAHVEIVPALIALCRRGRSSDELELSDIARRVLAFIKDSERPTAGQVRAYLRVPPKTWPNIADDALAELQRTLVVDRGTADVPDTGSPYLSRDGMPYRLFDRAHPAHVRAAAKLSIDAAAKILIGAYLDGAVFATRKKLAAMFKRCVSGTELDRAIAGLVTGKRATLDRVDKTALVVACTHA